MKKAILISTVSLLVVTVAGFAIKDHVDAQRKHMQEAYVEGLVRQWLDTDNSSNNVDLDGSAQADIELSEIGHKELVLGNQFKRFCAVNKEDKNFKVVCSYPSLQVLSISMYNQGLM